MQDSAPKAGLPQLGDVIADKYRLLRSIGEGGMGHVFEASHMRMGQRVAIKVLQPSVLQSGEVRSRFEREARAAGRLRGRHVARVLDVDTTPEKLPYMVMEFLEGHDLQTELERRGVFPIDEAIDYVLQACVGIGEAHDIGIIHRDLKPSNLFLCDEADRRVVKILDFGISKMLGEASKLTSTELTIGTPLYMSPEQVRSAKNVDARTDVWALGIILFELLTGRPPWIGSGPAVAAAIVTDDVPPLSEFRNDVSVELEAVIRTALAKKPADRFADVHALATALSMHAGSPNSLGRASFESAQRAARSTSSLVAPRTGEMAHAPTVLNEAAAPEAPSEASSGRRRANVTTAGWSTGGARRSTRRSRLWFFTALLAAVTAVCAAISAVVITRRPVPPVNTAVRSAAVATPPIDEPVSVDLPPTILPEPEPPKPGVVTTVPKPSPPRAPPIRTPAASPVPSATSPPPSATPKKPPPPLHLD